MKKKNLQKAINQLCAEAFKIASEKGFWSQPRGWGECIALIHSELSEALESVRRGQKQDTHCPEFSDLEIELADAVIRIFDLCAARGIDLGGAILAKMKFNRTRPHKHGKAF